MLDSLAEPLNTRIHKSLGKPLNIEDRNYLIQLNEGLAHIHT